MKRLDGSSGGIQVLDGLGGAIFPSSGTTLVHDLFNSAAIGTLLPSETPAIGPIPQTVSGFVDFEIGSGGTAVVSSGTSCADVYAGLGQSDCSINAFTTFASDSDLGFILRWVDDNNYWYCCYDAVAQQVIVNEILAGNLTEQAVTGVSGHTSGSYAFSAQASGTAISVNLDSGAGTASFNSTDMQTGQGFGLGAGFFGTPSSSDNFGPLIVTHP
jgi:hypothetical protein